MDNPLSNPDTLNLNPDWPEDLTEARYEGDYGCQASEAEDDHCGRVATQVRRECFTPARFKVFTCDEHADSTYSFDAEATAQLRRDVEREEALEVAY